LEEAVKALLARKLGFEAGNVGPLLQLTLLALTLSATGVYGYAAASALFLAGIGPEGIPAAYITIGALSIPLYAGLSNWIDRHERHGIIKWALVGCALAALVLWFALATGSPRVLFANYIFYFMAWVVLIQVLFPTLAADRFTVIEMKRAGPLFALGMALGGLFGGGVEVLLVRIMAPRDLMLGPLPMLLLCYWQTRRIERSLNPLQVTRGRERMGAAEALSRLPRLVRRFPVIPLISASVFLFVVLTHVAEFLAFSAYSAAYPSTRKLARFMGIIMAGQGLLQFAVVFLVTRYVIERLGVIRASLIYPLTTFASYLGLLFGFGVPAAVMANLNYSALGQSLDKPVFNLTYGSVPFRIAGMVRALGDGLFFALGLGASGVILLLANNLDLTWVVLLGLFVCLGAILVRIRIGRSYRQGLMTLLRDGSVDLDEMAGAMAGTSKALRRRCRALLLSPEPHDRSLGLDMALRLHRAGDDFQPEVDRLVRDPDDAVRAAAIRTALASGIPRYLETFKSWTTATETSHRRWGLLGLLAGGAHISAAEAEGLCRDPEVLVRVLATACRHPRVTSHQMRAFAVDELSRNPLNEADALDLLESVRLAGRPELQPLVTFLTGLGPRPETDLETIPTGPEATSFSVDAGVRALGRALSVPPRVRVAALKLLGQRGDPACLDLLVAGMRFPVLAVRTAAAQALASLGELGRDAAMELAESPRWDVADAAIQALAGSGAPELATYLLEFHRPYYRLLDSCRAWEKSVRQTPGLEPLQLVIGDFRQRMVRRTLLILGALGHERVARTVDRLLNSPEKRLRAGALEALLAAHCDEFVRPIQPLLEARAVGTGSHAVDGATTGATREELARVIGEMARAPDRWLRVAALVAARRLKMPLPGLLEEDPAPFVREVFQGLASPTASGPADASRFLDRLFFLKGMDLFANLWLDELLALTRVMVPLRHAPGDAVVAEGDPGREFFVVTGGTLQVRRAAEGEQWEVSTLGSGEPFGEMALFDTLPRSATVEAETEVELLRLDHDVYRSVVAESPHILLEMARVVASRHRGLQQLKSAAAIGTASRKDHGGTAEVTAMTRLSFLHQVPLFKELSLEQLTAVDRALEQSDYLAGEAVFEQGAMARAFYIVRRGEVHVEHEQEGRIRILGSLGPGQFFGEMALFGATTRSASVVAAEDSTLLLIELARFQTLVIQRPEILEQVIRVLSLRLRQTMQLS